MLPRLPSRIILDNERKNYGSITPTKTVKRNDQYCREYMQEVVIGGEKKKAYGQACRQPDGNWKIVQ